MKTLSLSLGVLVLLAGSVAPASAEPPYGPGRPEGRPRPDQQRADSDRSDGGRGMRREEFRQYRDDEGERRPQRLSPEERRELRQQINEAGRSLYPPKRHH